MGPSKTTAFSRNALLCCAGLLALPVISQAQDSRRGAEIQRIRAELNLTRERISALEDQLAALEAADTSHGKLEAAQAKSPTSRQMPKKSRSVSKRPEPAGRQDGFGSVDVDEEAAQRALERTLVSVGVLLLPPKRIEVEPYFRYARRTTDQPSLVAVDGGIAARTAEIRKNEIDAGLRLRVGLPYQSQLELDLPYRWIDRSIVQPVGLSSTAEDNESVSTLGDLRIGLAKTLLREQGYRPDLVGRVTWIEDTGERVRGSVATGVGYSKLQAGLTALKRQDPLAFTASLSYTAVMEADAIDPGDEWGFSLGASLAASPDTSLSLALVQSFSSETRSDGNRLPGSDGVSSVLAIGASSILGKSTLAAVSVGIGLTDDAPDYSVNLSLSSRFSP